MVDVDFETALDACPMAAIVTDECHAILFANRTQFNKALALPGNRDVVVYCLDLDGFKPVNDTFGHAAGDEVLRMVGERLKAVAPGHLVARLGGDEFAILRAGQAADADLPDRCVAAIRLPFSVGDQQIGIGTSIGIAAARSGETDRDGIMQAADQALYRAKAAGRNTWRMADTKCRDRA